MAGVGSKQKAIASPPIQDTGASEVVDKKPKLEHARCSKLPTIQSLIAELARLWGSEVGKSTEAPGPTYDEKETVDAQLAQLITLSDVSHFGPDVLLMAAQTGFVHTLGVLVNRIPAITIYQSEDDPLIAYLRKREKEFNDHVDYNYRNGNEMAWSFPLLEIFQKAHTNIQTYNQGLKQSLDQTLNATIFPERNVLSIVLDFATLIGLELKLH
jgi:hypothetical protein